MEWLNSLYESFYNALVPEQRYLAYLSGLQMTLLIAFFAVLLGVIIGMVVAVLKVGGRNSKNPLLRFLAKVGNFYTTVIRGTPVIVQVLIIYNLVFTSPDTNKIVVGTVCFGINSGAYVAEIIRAGIESVPRGQMEAGRSLGFHYIQTMRYIILPQAVKNILPALGNEFIVMVKETSVISVIAVNDLTKMAQYVGSRTWDIIPPMVIAAVIYLIITLILTKIMGIFERRLSQGDHH
ncbi:amino acid ABC transporter permease [Hominifimenecus sp. rT4P-3]|uniref:amino acid ABC transporter permease n=1 Tax=Hominifimenecus sp. rT4P-3 TaxID=3242979 RepID=UPI003DA1FC18